MFKLASHIELALRQIGRHLADQYPSTRGILLRLWEEYMFRYASLVCKWNALRYARRTTLLPFEVISVDPDQIEYLVQRNGYPTQTHEEIPFPGAKFKVAGTVRGGEWDKGGIRFEETDLYRAFEAHFEHGIDWRETRYFERCLEFIDADIELWGCTSRPELEHRFANVDLLYESIREHGLYSQAELVEAKINDPMADETQLLVKRRVYDEMTVCIGRDGDILYWDGRHRLAIAKLLDLDEIPVWVMVRHKQWQETRENVAKTQSPWQTLAGEIVSHPDMRTIVDQETDT